jgi:hypothetical protein
VLRQVGPAAERKRDADSEYEQAISRAGGVGVFHREIAAAAHVSHSTIRAILTPDTTTTDNGRAAARQRTGRDRRIAAGAHRLTPDGDDHASALPPAPELEHHGARPHRQIDGHRRPGTAATAPREASRTRAATITARRRGEGERVAAVGRCRAWRVQRLRPGRIASYGDQDDCRLDDN